MRKYSRRGEIFFFYKTFLFHPSFVTAGIDVGRIFQAKGREKGKKQKCASNNKLHNLCGIFLVEHSTKTTTIGIFFASRTISDRHLSTRWENEDRKKVPTHPPCHDLGIRDLGNEMRKVQELAHVP